MAAYRGAASTSDSGPHSPVPARTWESPASPSLPTSIRKPVSGRLDRVADRPRERTAFRPAFGPAGRRPGLDSWPAPRARDRCAECRNCRGCPSVPKLPGTLPSDDRLPGTDVAGGTFLRTSGRANIAWRTKGKMRRATREPVRRVPPPGDAGDGNAPFRICFRGTAAHSRIPGPKGSRVVAGRFVGLWVLKPQRVTRRCRAGLHGDHGATRRRFDPEYRSRIGSPGG